MLMLHLCKSYHARRGRGHVAWELDRTFCPTTPILLSSSPPQRHASSFRGIMPLFKTEMDGLGQVGIIIPLPVTNWASDKEKFIPNYSVEIIIFFILWSVEIIIFFILWSQHPYYDFNIHIMISTSNFSKLWSQQQISPNYDLNSVCVCTNTISSRQRQRHTISHICIR